MAAIPRAFLLCAAADPWASPTASGWRLVMVGSVRVATGGQIPASRAFVVLELTDPGPHTVAFHLVAPDGTVVAEIRPRTLPAGPTPRVDHFDAPLPAFTVSAPGVYEARLIVDGEVASVARLEVEAPFTTTPRADATTGGSIA